MTSVCAITATRAEWGLLVWPLRELQARGITIRIAATGAHLSPRFGETWRDIEADGFTIDARIAMNLDSDAPADLTRSLGAALSGFGDALGHLKPDAVILLGDRYELLAAATAALMARIPILHVSGGDTTEGALDEQVRHAITKMAHWHFPSTEVARRRIIQMGEAPERVFTIGATGLDNIRRLTLVDRAALSARLDFDLSGDYVLVTYHPATLAEASGGIEPLLAALDAQPGLKVLVTGTNADPGSSSIAARLDAYARANPRRIKLVQSLGQVGYLSAMSQCRAVIGNSSSGIIEAPSMGVPTLNLGDRQKGRERAASVIDCAETPEAIQSALAKALSPDFAEFCRGVENPYGDGTSAIRFAEIVAKLDLRRAGPKVFHNV